MANLTLIGAVNDGLMTAMREDPSVLVFGEDVGKKGGVFLATDGLQAEFGEGRPSATDEDLAPVLAGLGLDAAALLADAVSPEGKQALRSNTDAALEAGVFGAPTFTTEDGEVFWGSDRLAQALAWATSRTA